MVKMQVPRLLSRPTYSMCLLCSHVLQPPEAYGWGSKLGSDRNDAALQDMHCKRAWKRSGVLTHVA